MVFGHVFRVSRVRQSSGQNPCVPSRLSPGRAGKSLPALVRFLLKRGTKHNFDADPLKSFKKRQQDNKRTIYSVSCGNANLRKTNLLRSSFFVLLESLLEQILGYGEQSGSPLQARE